MTGAAARGASRGESAAHHPPAEGVHQRRGRRAHLRRQLGRLEAALHGDALPRAGVLEVILGSAPPQAGQQRRVRCGCEGGWRDALQVPHRRGAEGREAGASLAAEGGDRAEGDCRHEGGHVGGGQNGDAAWLVEGGEEAGEEARARHADGDVDPERGAEVVLDGAGDDAAAGEISRDEVPAMRRISGDFVTGVWGRGFTCRCMGGGGNTVRGSGSTAEMAWRHGPLYAGDSILRRNPDRGVGICTAVPPLGQAGQWGAAPKLNSAQVA